MGETALTDKQMVSVCTEKKSPPHERGNVCPGERVERGGGGRAKARKKYKVDEADLSLDDGSQIRRMQEKT